MNMSRLDSTDWISLSIATLSIGFAAMESGRRGSAGRNLDYGQTTSDAQEGRMLRGTLRNIEADARAMHDLLEDDDDLPQWVHSKVETSADRINSSFRYLRSKIQGGGSRNVGRTIIDQLRKIVDEKQRAPITYTVDGKRRSRTVDLFSASTVVAVYDALNAANREKLLSMPLDKMIEVSFKLVK
jgi:hypothetical protein